VQEKATPGKMPDSVVLKVKTYCFENIFKLGGGKKAI
jgi:hypothetical protein